VKTFILTALISVVSLPLALGATSKTEATAAKIEAQNLSVKDATTEFFAIGKPSMLKIHGESKQTSGTVSHAGNTLSGKLEIPLDSFETGMAVRNEHLKNKVFEVSKYQKAILTISKLVLPEGKTGEIKNLPFEGTLNLHGVEKPVTGTANITADKEVAFEASFSVKLTDFNIPPPEFMGMTIQNEVKVKADGKAKL
jgi:polyisoprenoid-binding protein YceI